MPHMGWDYSLKLHIWYPDGERTVTRRYISYVAETGLLTVMAFVAEVINMSVYPKVSGLSR
jgi:hypothetical protein